MTAFTDFDAIPRGQYGAIYADPPWYFKCFGAKGTGRGAFSHYDLMSDDQLRALPVADIAAKHCMLFLWVPIPLREFGMELILDRLVHNAYRVELAGESLRKTRAPKHAA